MLKDSEDGRFDYEFVSPNSFVPEGHLLRRIERAVDFSKVYEFTKEYYTEDFGRPAVDPVVLIKMSIIQHLYGIKSLRQTVVEVELNIAYRWFLGYGFSEVIPHFSTLSYAFSKRFPSEVFRRIFEWILSELYSHGFLSTGTVYIDSTHIKANANNKKRVKKFVEQAVRNYDIQLRREINELREKEGRPPDDNEPPAAPVKEVITSKTDPESGLFVKDEHKSEFSYKAHTACDERNTVVGVVVTAGNVHDSRVFDGVYEQVKRYSPDTIAVDAGYRTPWICKQVQDDSRNISVPYVRPRGKKGRFRANEYVYNAACNVVVCPENKELKYRGVTKRGEYMYRTEAGDCRDCGSKSKCTVSKAKKVLKHIWHTYIDKAEEFRHTEAGKVANRRRSETIERVFADAKEKHSMRYTLYTGLVRVTNWVMMKFAVMNLKKLALSVT
jgi:transposase